jgi:hypothetical protein
MTFPLSIFLYIYLAFLAVWALFVFTSMYHILKFGVKNMITFSVTFIFIAVAVFLLFFSYLFISEIQWDMNVTILGGLFNNNIY